MGSTTAVQKSTGTAPATALNSGERFAAAVRKEFGQEVGSDVEQDEHRNRLMQGYFVCIDKALKVAEVGRVKKNTYNRDHKWDNTVPVTWESVNLPSLAKDIVANARLGLDMTIPNQLYPIPYYNKDTKLYDINLMKGYNGIIHIAEKYALHKPKNVTVELVYSTDFFAAIKKSRENPVESYEFEIKQPFARGEVVGGFGYIEFDEPNKNKLVLMDLDAILKRKPQKASVEFWGGVKTEKKWNAETKSYEEVEVEVAGWIEEMYLKVIKREVYSGKYLPIDPDKIDDNYRAMVERDMLNAEIETEREIEENANAVPIAAVAQAAPVNAAPADKAESEPF